MQITPTGETLGVRIEGIDLAQPLSDADRRLILRALGQHGVLCFPAQTLTTPQFAACGRRFGELEINVANLFFEPDFPRAQFPHVHHSTEGDLLMWDNIGTMHDAVADYLPDEPRYMRRMQVMATLDYGALVA